MSSIYVAIICKSAIKCFIYSAAANSNIIIFAIRSKIMGIISIIASVCITSYMTALNRNMITDGFANHIRTFDISDLAFFQQTMIIFSRCLTACSVDGAARTVSNCNIRDLSTVVIYSYNIVL